MTFANPVAAIEDALPPPYNLVARFAAPVVGAVLAITFVAAVLGAVFLKGKAAGVAKEAPKVAAAAGAAAVGQGQAAAGQDATKILDAASDRLARTLAVQQENARALAIAPGADQGLDPRLNDAGRRGLCRYAAYADDPGCAELRPADPGQLPPAGAGDAAPRR